MSFEISNFLSGFALLRLLGTACYLDVIQKFFLLCLSGFSSFRPKDLEMVCLEHLPCRFCASDDVSFMDFVAIIKLPIGTF